MNLKAATRTVNTVNALLFPEPVVETYNEIDVIRDDLIPGGTKSRYLYPLFQRYDTVVYATPACGGAQVALAECARLTGKQAVLFVAKRREPHPHTIQAAKAGAIVYQVQNGYLNVVQSRAKKYAADKGVFYLAFGADMPQAIQAIAQAAARLPDEYDEVWCAAGSGVLTRGLQQAFQNAVHHAVQVGREPNAGNAVVHQHPLKYEQVLNLKTPFPANGNYERKAWQFCARYAKGRVLFWNVLG